MAKEKKEGSASLGPADSTRSNERKELRRGLEGKGGARTAWHLNPPHVVDLVEGTPFPDSADR